MPFTAVCVWKGGALDSGTKYLCELDLEEGHYYYNSKFIIMRCARKLQKCSKIGYILQVVFVNSQRSHKTTSFGTKQKGGAVILVPAVPSSESVDNFLPGFLRNSVTLHSF